MTTAKFSWKTLAVGMAVTLPLLLILGSGFFHDPQEMDRPLVGKKAPDFEVKDVISGDTVRLSALAGRPVVVNFWATWCVPCAQEHATLVRGGEQYGKDVSFVGIVYQDDEDKVRAWLGKHGNPPYAQGIDVNARTAIAYGVYGVPETYFIDRQGMIRWKQVGPLNPAALAARIREIL